MAYRDDRETALIAKCARLTQENASLRTDLELHKKLYYQANQERIDRRDHGHYSNGAYVARESLSDGSGCVTGIALLSLVTVIFIVGTIIGTSIPSDSDYHPEPPRTCQC